MRLSILSYWLLPFLLLLPLPSVVAALPEPLAVAVEKAIKKTMPHANIGIALADARTGKIIYERNGNEKFIPASNTKLFSGAAALYYLGADFRFQTTISARQQDIQHGVVNGDLYIGFNGDPSLTANDLQGLIAGLRAQGIHTIKGSLVIDDTRFTKPYYANGWNEKDRNRAFSAPISSVIINQNVVDIFISPGKTVGSPARVRLEPSLLANAIPLTNQITTAADAGKRHCAPKVALAATNHVIATGCFPINKKTLSFRLAINHPTALAAQVIKNLVLSDQINFKGSVISNVATPSDATVLARHTSEPLITLMRPIMKNSNNVYAESVTKMMGSLLTGVGSFQQGAHAIEQILKRYTDLDFRHIKLFDGSGASRYNTVTPRQMVRLLYSVLHSEQIGTAYFQTLPRSGVDGTMRNRMNSKELVGQVQAKTGAIKGVSTLTGIIASKSGKPVLFSVLINQMGPDRSKAKALQAALGTLFYNYDALAR